MCCGLLKAVCLICVICLGILACLSGGGGGGRGGQSNFKWEDLFGEKSSNSKTSPQSQQKQTDNFDSLNDEQQDSQYQPPLSKMKMAENNIYYIHDN